MKYKIRVDKIFYPKKSVTDANDYCIFSAIVNDVINGDEPVLSQFGTISIKGNMPSIKSGMELSLNLDSEKDKRFGLTYKVLNVIVDFNFKDKKEMQGFLEGITTQHIASKLMEFDNPIQIIKDKDVDTLKKIKGLGDKGIERLLDNFSAYEDWGYAYAKLMPLGITKELITKMCKSIKDAKLVVDMCYANPFKLIDKIPNFGFLKADEIASKCGYLDTDTRNKYAILHILKTYGERGQSYMQSMELVSELRKMSTSEFSDIDKVVGQMVEDGLVMLVDNGIYIASVEYFKLEKSLHEEILRLRNSEKEKPSRIACSEKIKELEEEQGWEFTEEQRSAIIGAVTSSFSVICGKAGTGKTTVIKAIIKILSELKKTDENCFGELVELTSLSAKACQRMSETTGEKASTIHRLLGIGIDGLCDDKMIYCDTLIIDESTMVSGSLFLKLFRAINQGTRVVMLGDVGQLTAIGNCSVFEDLIVSKLVPIYELTTIHRQAQKSAIITSSMCVREKKRFFEKGFIGTKKLGELQDLELIMLENESVEMLDCTLKSFVEQYKLYPDIMDVQIITPLKNRGIVSCMNINIAIQNLLGTPKSLNHKICKNNIPIYVGDKIINTKNNYSATGIWDNGEEYQTTIFNGNMGIVKEITPKGMLIDFFEMGQILIKNNSLFNIDLGYAITTHSSQGSQWKNVVAVVDISSYMLLNIEMMYTILTRASENCVLISKNNAIEKCISTEEKRKKLTFLKLI